MQFLGPENNFLGIAAPEHFSWESSKVAIQQAPYEHTSSYISGSEKGPAAVISASHYVEFYDEETETEHFQQLGICTLPAMQFGRLTDRAAVDLIRDHTRQLIQAGKYVVSLGAEHTVTLGFVEAHLEQYPD